MESFVSKNHNKKSYKIILIALFVMIFILILLTIMIKFLQSQDTSELTFDNLTTIKEVIEYHKSKYISENESNEDDFYLDVYLKFKVLPYDENKNSNEEYYNSLIEDCARIILYKSFILIDEENDLTVKVICNENEVSSIIINGIEDYFIYMDSQISMEKYREIPTTELNVDSELLQECINNSWDSNTYIGERSSIFNEYNIYFEQGIKTRIIKNKIYNIVFDKRYNGDIINGLFPGLDFSTIKAKLGDPTFSDEEVKVIGYKSDKFYVFFSENEISIYRNDTTKTDDFFKLADRFIKEDIDFLDFMNELTYIWPDYSDYEYNSNSVFISYPLKGIEIQLNNGDRNGILVYNNIRSGLQQISKYLENTNFVARLQLDLVYEAEKRRFLEQDNLLNKCKEYKEKKSLSEEEQKIIGKSLNYEIYAEEDSSSNIYSIKFISKMGDSPNRELNDRIDDYLWAGNDYFIYSKEGKGIFLYNLNDGLIKRIVTGSKKYELKQFENGILKYDNQEINVEF